jgi:SprT-like protein
LDHKGGSFRLYDPGSLSIMIDMKFPDNTELVKLSRILSLKVFGVFPDISFSFNSRLKRVLGRLVYLKFACRFEPLRKEIASSIYGNEELLTGTILHELSHYYLMINGRDFSHSSQDFKKLSSELGFDIRVPAKVESSSGSENS